MTQILETLRITIESLIQTLGYPGVALIMFIENLIPPIPSEFVMPFSGFLVAEGRFTFVAVLIAGTVGAVVGAIFLYYLSHWLGEERVREWTAKYGKYLLFTEEEFDEVMDAFASHGSRWVFFARLVPGVRSLISIPAGLEEMNLVKFLLYTTLGTALWNTILIGAGILLGENWQRVLDFVGTYETVLWMLLGGALAYYLISRWKRRRENHSREKIWS